jgi:hypothetical protein
MTASANRRYLKLFWFNYFFIYNSFFIETKNNIEKMDGDICYRYVIYRKHTLFDTETVAHRGFWCPSISLSKQEAEVQKRRLLESDNDRPLTKGDNFFITKLLTFHFVKNFFKIDIILYFRFRKR